MHKSRLGGLSIDCQTNDLDRAAKFWSAALGHSARPPSNPEFTNYAVLEVASNELSIEVQKVEHPSRVHLDIETDDIAAEVGRLEKLGAKRVAQVHDWWVMEAPTGQRFCVVKAQRSGFATEANVWR